jgi:hypothetical protein
MFAFLDGPAILAAPSLTVAPLVDGQEIELAFDMDGNSPPTLLITLYCFQGNPQQLGKSFLGFPQLRPQFGKYLATHTSTPAVFLLILTIKIPHSERFSNRNNSHLPMKRSSCCKQTGRNPGKGGNNRVFSADSLKPAAHISQISQRNPHQ